MVEVARNVADLDAQVHQGNVVDVEEKEELLAFDEDDAAAVGRALLSVLRFQNPLSLAFYLGIGPFRLRNDI